MELRNGMPYWLIKNGLLNNYEKLSGDTETQVLIIGGGISGAMNAYFLANAGVDCVLVEKGAIAQGSTCTSTSLLQYELDTPLSLLSEQIGFRQASRAYHLGAEAIDDLRYIMQTLKCDEFEKSGSLFYASTKKDETLIKEEFEIRKKAGLHVEYLNGNEVEARFGFKTTNAIYSSHAACVDPYKLTHALLQYVIKKGVQVFNHTGLTDINYESEGVTVRTNTGFSIKAKQIVNASGGFTQKFIDQYPLRLYNSYAIISEPGVNESTLNAAEKCMFLSSANPYLYIRTTSDQRIVVGGRDEAWVDGNQGDRILKTKSRQLAADFKRLFGTELKTEYSWSGVYTGTADTLPLVGAVSTVPHTFFTTGFGGNGITLSLVAAEIIRDKLLGHSHRDEELFSFERKTAMAKEFVKHPS